MTLALLALLAVAMGGGWALTAPERRQRRLLVERIALLQPAPDTPAAPRERPQAPSALAPFVDPLLGIDRSVASDARMGLLAPLLLLAVATALAFLCLSYFLDLSGPLALPLALGCGLMAARLSVAGRRDGIRRRMEDEFALALGVIIRCVRAGLPVTEGMRAVAAEVPAPTGPEFRRCVDQIQLGEDFDRALGAMAQRCAISDYRFFAVSVSLQRQTGGNLAETLDNLSETIRKRKAVRLRAQALTSETRATVLVLALLPVAVGIILMFVNPAYVMQLFTTSGGKTLLGIAVCTQAFGLFVIRMIIRKSLR